ncbi:hypothetical protein [Pseudomonas phage UF_RH7]|nr:hypothetical protein [Pseudomonas phage UF_RH7]
MKNFPLPAWVTDPTLSPSERYLARCRFMFRIAAAYLGEKGGISSVCRACGYASDNALYSALNRRTIPPAVPLAIEAIVGKDVISRDDFERLPNEIDQ